MKKIILSLLLINILLLSSCSSNKETTKPSIAVSIVPEEQFLKKIVLDKYNIVTLIPSGSSPTTYQPSPKQLRALEESDLYFSIGVATESANILPMLKDNKTIKIIDLAKNVDLIFAPRFFDSEKEKKSRDPHIWLSPKRVIEIVKIMEKELIIKYPENKDFFSQNANDYILELEALDNYIKEKVTLVKNKSFIIYHPSYGYFAKDYGLNMIAIELNGKNANIDRLNTIIDIAEKKNIKAVYYQSEMSSKQAKIIASEIDAIAVQIEPLSLDYIKNQKKLVDTMVGE
ncbi:MAG: zinc ABC transporter substrate-binding protein [Bacillota bacterium]|nr:zinc ABC transporter substrate-binding protein [Bacillota bacterium]